MTVAETMFYLERVENTLEEWHEWFNQHEGEEIDSSVYHSIKLSVIELLGLKRQLIDALTIGQFEFNI